MSVFTLFEVPIKPEEISNMKSYLAEILPGTRAYDGCRGVDAYFNTEDNTVVALEHWDSHSHHEKYIGWRTETGVMAKLSSMFAGTPSIRYFERIDA